MKTRSDPFPHVSYDEWRRRVEQELGDESFEESLVTHLPSGVAVEPLYTAEFPADRADRPGLEFGRNWLPCQLFIDPDLTQLAAELHADLESGVKGIWLRLDQAVRWGEVPEAASRRVGHDGTTLYRLSDFQEVLRQDREQWRLLILDSGGSFLPASAAILACFEDPEVDPGDRTIVVGGDPLGAMTRDGISSESLEILERDLTELVRYCDSIPEQWRALCVSVAHYREAGADIAQELGLALATSVHYSRVLEREGLEIGRAANQLVLVTAVGQDIFAEISKLRAFRQLWSRVLEKCGIEKPPQPWIHGTILRRDLGSQEPWSHQLRATIAGFAAVLGGVDSLETPAFRASDGQTSARDRRLARNIQHILGEESHLCRVADTSGGSYYVETLTQDLMQAAWDFFQQIEAVGGMSTAVQSGWIERWLGEKRARGSRESAGTKEKTSSVGDDHRLRMVTAAQERYAQQGEVGHVDDIPRAPSGDRLRWCIEHLRRGASLQDLYGALYPRLGGKEAET